MGAEDFGAVIVSTSVSTSTSNDGSRLKFTSSSNPHYTTISQVPVPTSTPALTPAPVHALTPTRIPECNPFPLVLSSRNNVGFPDYTYHPSFVQSGVSVPLATLVQTSLGLYQNPTGPGQ